MSFWVIIEERIFNKQTMETPEIVRRVEALYEIFLEKFLGDEMLVTFKVARGNKNSYQAKQKVIAELKKYNAFFSKLFSREVNLLTERGFLELFGIKDHSELKMRNASLKERNRALNARVQNFLGSEVLSGRNIFSKLSRHFLGTSRPSLYWSDVVFFKKSPSIGEVKGLIKKLRLAPKLEQSYLNDLDVLLEFFRGALNKTTENMSYTLVLFKAFEDGFGKRSGAFLHSKNHLRMQSVLSVKIKIQQAEYARVIVEAQMEGGYLNKSEELNARIDKIQSTALRRGARYSQHKENYRRFEEEAASLKVRGFDEDLVGIEQEVSRLEVELDELTEGVLKEVRNESIVDFEGLNNRWGRLLPDREYQIEGGSDYKTVSFGSDVIDFFEKDHLTGSRYLVALSKSYVALQDASGLRKIPKLHRSFRDVKMLRSGGKVRIVGKLINDNIYFFRIYNNERAYDSDAVKGWMNSQEGD